MAKSTVALELASLENIQSNDDAVELSDRNFGFEDAIQFASPLRTNTTINTTTTNKSSNNNNDNNTFTQELGKKNHFGDVEAIHVDLDSNLFGDDGENPLREAPIELQVSTTPLGRTTSPTTIEYPYEDPLTIGSFTTKAATSINQETNLELKSATTLEPTATATENPYEDAVVSDDLKTQSFSSSPTPPSYSLHHFHASKERNVSADRITSPHVFEEKSSSVELQLPSHPLPSPATNLELPNLTGSESENYSIHRIPSISSLKTVADLQTQTTFPPPIHVTSSALESYQILPPPTPSSNPSQLLQHFEKECVGPHIQDVIGKQILPALENMTHGDHITNPEALQNSSLAPPKLPSDPKIDWNQKYQQLYGRPESSPFFIQQRQTDLKNLVCSNFLGQYQVLVAVLRFIFSKESTGIACKLEDYIAILVFDTSKYSSDGFGYRKSS